MAHVNDVAAYILARIGPMTAMKLQKLCYYAYGYHLAWEGRRLFPEQFEAWANGPVSPVLYAEHRDRFELDDGDIAGDPDVLDEGERESVDIVLSNLGDLSAHDLSTMTHREPPWINARTRARVGPLDRCDESIDDEEIYTFFDALVAADGRQA
ncbi:hypothetical protein Skr01_54620 [Sphaerisporangium krabiense]|uniref:Putative phage-associated protein n=1 Tax=Sphaerisporangium krabiense TaxID=763782 RepID=A0A7W9DQ74_9ACTN|nr:type II toxin-antitoxin system antitoxin SocA domain-containing protein [Sphaerisporangium krabiense]MBB5627216.1 putative phage-associated protein [Sphaerisporangium krabiense]GII65377.1 hypothetical protein Skr01_54620 [Sphaerisporangium krabiense]